MEQILLFVGILVAVLTIVWALLEDRDHELRERDFDEHFESAQRLLKD